MQPFCTGGLESSANQVAFPPQSHDRTNVFWGLVGWFDPPLRGGGNHCWSPSPDCVRKGELHPGLFSNRPSGTKCGTGASWPANESDLQAEFVYAIALGRTSGTPGRALPNAHLETASAVTASVLHWDNPHGWSGSRRDELEPSLRRRRPRAGCLRGLPSGW